MSEFRVIRPSQLAVRFFAVAAVALSSAGGITTLLIRLGRATPPAAHVRIPGAFWVSTLLLAGGSLSLHWAVKFVRREKQRQFRLCLWAGVLCGTLFVGVQGYGLWVLTRAFREGMAAGSDELITGEFGVVFAGLHAVHFIVALLFVIYTTVHALSYRYDHEYYFGIQFCAWFWHALGIVWGAILMILLLMTMFVSGPSLREGARSEVWGGSKCPPVVHLRRTGIFVRSSTSETIVRTDLCSLTI